MQIVRTAIWILLLLALVLFTFANWDPIVTVRIWDGIVIDTKIPAIVIISVLIAFVPMWLYHRAIKWNLKRRIASLENAARTAAMTPLASPPSPAPRPSDDGATVSLAAMDASGGDGGGSK